MNSLFFKFFFSEFFSPSSIIQYTCTKNICTEKIYLSFKSKSKLTEIYIFLTLNGPYRIKQIISFFILKKTKPKQLKLQLISWQVKFKKLGICNRFTSLCFQNASTNDWSIAVFRSTLFHRTDTCVAYFCCVCAGACAVSRIA